MVPVPFGFMDGILCESGLLFDRKRKIESQEEVLSLSDTLFNEDALIFFKLDIDCEENGIRKES